MRTYSFLQPIPCNFRATKDQLHIWQWSSKYFERSRAIELLKRIGAEQERIAQQAFNENGNLFWLLPFRDEIRQRFSGDSAVCGPGEADKIYYYLSYCPPRMNPVCIWLISRCTSRFRLFGIPNFVRDPSPAVRKHVAKALRRLEAWTLLDEMATLYPDDAHVQWFAHAKTTFRSFPERLANFARNLDDSHAGEVTTPSQMPFWAIERSWDYTAPKSAVVIRRMLRRIRHWVRWQQRQTRWCTWSLK